MIHLKRFNESVSEWDLNLVRKFCYENLAYLLDGPVDINFHYYENTGSYGNYYRVIIKNINSKWSDIETDVCPFLELLEEKYNLITMMVGSTIIPNSQVEFMYSNEYSNKKPNSERIWFSINEIISGCVEPNAEIKSMRFMIRL